MVQHVAVVPQQPRREAPHAAQHRLHGDEALVPRIDGVVVGTAARLTAIARDGHLRDAGRDDDDRGDQKTA